MGRLSFFSRRLTSLWLILLTTSLYCSELELTFIPSQGASWQNYILVDTVLSSVFSEVGLVVEPLAPVTQEFERLSPEQLEELKVHFWLHQKRPKLYRAFLKLGTLSPFNLNWREVVLLLGIDPASIEKDLPSIKVVAGQVKSSKLYLGQREIPIAWNLTTAALSINEALPPAERHKNIKASHLKETQNPNAEVVVISGEDLTSWAKIDAKHLDNLRRLPFSLTFKHLPSLDPQAKEILTQSGVDLVPAVFLRPLDGKAKKLLEDMSKRGGLENKDPEQGLFFARGFSSSGVLTRPPSNESSTLKLFIMSECPFGVAAQRALSRIMQDKQFPQDVALETHFIVSRTQNKEGGFDYGSLHGKGELEEDIRQLVVAHYFPDRLSCYLQKRLPNIDSSLWMDVLEECKISANKFQKLFKDKGLDLLNAEFEESERYDVSSSPTFIWKDRFVLAGLDSLKNLDEFKNIDLRDTSGDSAPSGKCQ